MITTTMRGGFRTFAGPGFLLTAVMSFTAIWAFAARSQDPVAAQPPKKEPIDKPDGHVTRVDAAKGEVAIDYGRKQGAELGMTISITGKNPNPPPEAGFEFVYLGVFEVIRVDEGGCIVKRITGIETRDRPEFPNVQVGDRVYNSTDLEAFRIQKLAKRDDPETIRVLLKARVDTAKGWLEFAEAFFENGTITSDRLLAASRDLMEAEREAARNDGEQVAAIEAHLMRIRRLIERSNRKVVLGEDGSSLTLTEARAELAKVAFMLTKARRGKRPGG